MKYIVAQSTPLENSKDNVYEVNDPELVQKYKAAGYQLYKRSYDKIKCHHKEYTVNCLEFRNDSTGEEPVVIIPDFLSPRRHYPVYVYLYAILLYCLNLARGQRWAAEKTRKYFGLDTFSHTTLGRALKAFVRNITEEEPKPEPEPEPVPAEDTGAETQKPGVPTAQATAVVRKQVAEFLHSRLGQVEQPEIIGIYCQLASEWYKQHQKLLL